ncbi:hypothetical protein AVEN_82265-1 [Araneus ventricosus]|uniref:Uncharacterized protein n=1 Tax=Araneus ventricosus TaxID=182803 RepID=A0A4Y2HDN3_ARAVE|nr:hypothetical protein AVEN_82265-1 [Araneus ventricosus]
MASDLKIEIFAYKCFHDAWLHKGVKDTELNILQIYGNECMKDDSYLEACDNMFENAIGCRVILFSKVYLKEMNLRNAIKWKSLSECYDHVTRICDRDDLFGPLSVFERMLATCAFDLNVCLSIFRPSFIDVANYGHFIWAMYFNKFTDKFYREENDFDVEEIIEEKLQSTFCSTGMTYSKLSDNGKEIKTNDDLRIQTDESEWQRKNLPNPSDFCSKNKVVKNRVKREISKDALVSSFYAKNEDICNKNNEITCASTTNEMAATQSERNGIPKNLSSPKDFLAVNEVATNSDGRINTKNELDKLREEQDDPGIGSFLKFLNLKILVLGDRQGIQCVRETLCSNEEDQKNAQIKSNKRKYRSKNHSTKCFLIN